MPAQAFAQALLMTRPDRGSAGPPREAARADRLGAALRSGNTTATFVRVRLLLALVLINGLVPGLGEVVESVVHYAAEGHLAHSEADHGDLGDQGDEHGCGTTEHRCLCCASQPLSAPPVTGVARRFAAIVARPHVDDGSLESLDAPAPQLRPPITA